MNETKICPLCGEEMEYLPRQHWTGVRFIILQHEWVCHKIDRGSGHHLKLFERNNNELD